MGKVSLLISTESYILLPEYTEQLQINLNTYTHAGQI